MVGTAVGDRLDAGDDLAIVDRILDLVGARRLLVLQVELDVDEEPLAVATLVLEDAVKAVEDDAAKLDRHATLPRSTAAAAARAST